MSASCIMALALLSAPLEEPVPVVDPGEWPALRAALSAEAIEREILDPREDRLVHLEELAADLAVLRRRYHELSDAPPLQDAKRFPDRHQVAELLKFNRAYRRHLESRQAIDHDRGYLLREAVREADELHGIWDMVREAGCSIYYLPVRRAALKRLREGIGETAYAAGDLPPHVPLWRFVDVR